MIVFLGLFYSSFSCSTFFDLSIVVSSVEIFVHSKCKYNHSLIIIINIINFIIINISHHISPDTLALE